MFDMQSYNFDYSALTSALQEVLADGGLATAMGANKEGVSPSSQC